MQMKYCGENQRNQGDVEFSTLTISYFKKQTCISDALGGEYRVGSQSGG